MIKRKQKLIGLIMFLLFIGAKTTNAQNMSIRAPETINVDSVSYGNDAKKSIFKKFCSVVPAGWECEIITSGFNKSDITEGSDTNPIAVIKYLNPNKEFTSYRSRKLNPSLILNLYSINRKQELINNIKLYQDRSWCIPIYYGETKDYFIITSPCFINGGIYTDEANSCINELHKALKSIITINDNVNNNQTDDAYEYFINAELQCETKSQRESIITALNDLLNLDLSEDELKNKRYPNYTGEENQWDLPTLIYRYFVPAEQKTLLGKNFYTKNKRKASYKQIQEILTDIQKSMQTPEIKVENKISFYTENNNNDIVEFTLIVTNLSDTLSVPVLSNDNIYKHAIFFINNKEVTNPASMGGLEPIREKKGLSENEGDYFTWGTSVDYLKNEYGNIFTVQWKYLDVYSNILEVNIENNIITDYYGFQLGMTVSEIKDITEKKSLIIENNTNPEFITIKHKNAEIIILLMSKGKCTGIQRLPNQTPNNQ